MTTARAHRTPRQVQGGSEMPSSSGHWFATDSPVEQSGFEPLVPLAMGIVSKRVLSPARHFPRKAPFFQWEQVIDYIPPSVESAANLTCAVKFLHVGMPLWCATRRTRTKVEARLRRHPRQGSCRVDARQRSGSVAVCSGWPAPVRE